MTIEEKITNTLSDIKKSDKTLHDICYQLNNSVDDIINEVSDHLSKIQTQMPDYDKHDKEHSRKVLENIELLLQEKGINELTLLEAILIKLCCYFHDTGMALPDWSFKLLKAVEDDNYTFHNTNTPITEITSELRSDPNKLNKKFDDVKDLFFCPKSESELFSFLAQEILNYEHYRMGIANTTDEMERETYLVETRQEYLRSTHGKRAKTYANHISKKLSVIDEYDASLLAGSVGNICSGHCQEIKEIQNLKFKIRICGGKSSGEELTYNERFIAILLRLGDVIHFSADRTSRTLYAEHTPMNPVSDAHWRVKLENLHYRIEQKNGSTNITYFAGFTNPKMYYFLQDYLDWVDEELQYYASFVQDMEQFQKTEAARYRIGLPTKVNRENIKAMGYTPDNNLKFRLEQQKIIQLLMGMRLYSDEFMCLRELYQNSLDACRCMRAQNQKNGLTGDLEIEFGISVDQDGDYLYCRDAGTGMTKDVVLNYLLRVGNSYYKSSDFRRENALLGDSVAPVSEFGIGLLSCYMIGSRIEVITRHYSDNSELLWICMEGTENYGYFREVSPEISEKIGAHGTIVKVYLKEEFKNKITTNIPEDIENAVFLYKLYSTLLEKNDENEETLLERIDLSDNAKEMILNFHNSLYQKLQTYIHIPEKGIPVYITDAKGVTHPMINSTDVFDFSQKIELLEQYRVPTERISRRFLFSDDNVIFNPQKMENHKKAAHQFKYYKCMVTDEKTKAEAFSIIRLPIEPITNINFALYDLRDHFVGLCNENITLYIDGIPVDCESDMEFHYYITTYRDVQFNFSGTIRPILTVNREDVRELSETVKILMQEMKQKLINEIVNVVIKHFTKYPNMKTNETFKFFDLYLRGKYNHNMYFNIIHQLSKGLLNNYSICDNMLGNLLSNPSFSIATSFPVRFWYLHSPIYNYLLSKTKNINIGDDVVTVEIEDFTECDSCVDFFYRHLDDLCICVENWKGKFYQYDIVTDFWPFIPKRMFLLCDEKGSDLSKNAKIKNLMHSYNKINLSDIVFRLFDDSDPYNQIRRSDILMLLSSTTSDGVNCKCPIEGVLDEENKKYVIYAFINPKELSEKEEAELNYFEDKPGYVQGLREGWSVLFYRYEDGYVIAPGIVSREEMIEKIPDIAKKHNDGITYCFTDGAVAF